MPKIGIGIDLGTTYSCVAIHRDGKVQIIANNHSQYTTPSYVAFTDEGRIFGEAAKSQASSNPKKTIFDAKRLIGRKATDASLQEDKLHWPFELIVDDENRIKIKVETPKDTLLLLPEEISAMLLGHLKGIAEEFLGSKVDDVVITVPAYFNDAQRYATKLAGEIAGLKVMKIINEPTAAAIAYGLDMKKAENERDSTNLLVFDLGGGTFDVTILTIEDGIFEVKATCGDTHLGGQDFDNEMVKFCMDDFKKKTGIDITKDPRAISRLKEACEKAKKALSTSQTANINVDALSDGKYYQGKLERSRFDKMNEANFNKVLAPLEQALKDAGMKEDDIDDIVMVGGSTKIPKIHNLLHERFRNCKINKDINPDEAVAKGAALFAAKLIGTESQALREIALLDVTPLSLGVEISGGIMSVIIQRNTTVPVSQKKTYTVDRNNQTVVHIKVFQGERKLTIDNSFLNEFRLVGLQNARVNQTEIEVDFSLDHNGILNVSAMDISKKDGARLKNEVKIQTQSLSSEDVKNMIKRAEEFRLQDEKEKVRIEARNNLEYICLKMQGEVRLTEAKAKVSGSEREKVLTACAEALSWMESNMKADKQVFDERYKAVHLACDPIRRKIYEKGAACCEESDDEYKDDE